MSEFESDVALTDRRVSKRRQSSNSASVERSISIERSASVDCRAEETEGPTDSFLLEERRQIADRRRQDRRRQIDPTTCERDYSCAEIEFMRAMDDYKRKSGRPFPTWSEVLEVVMSLGYRKVAEPSVMAWRTFGDSSQTTRTE